MNGLAAPKPPSLDIMPAAPTPRAILGGGAPPAPQAPAMREFGDAKTTRRFIYEDALAAANNIEPLEDDNYQLKLSGVDWHDPERFSRKQRKQAILTGETLARRMRGTWELYDKKSGQLLGKRQQIIGAVPYLSSMGTFIHRGNEYTVNHQQRLRPGVFARIRDNGELESHFNILPGKGVSHRYFLDPEKGAFKVKFGQSEMPLMPLLYSMGATDREIRDAWGGELWQANAATNDTSVLKKLGQKLLRRRDLEGATDGDTSRRLAERFAAMELDPEVTSRTLGKGYDRVTKEAILAATAKLLKVNRKEADPDDRDHLAYQQFVGPEDLFSERLRRDHGGVRRGLFKKIAQAGTLDRMPSGALTPQLTQVLLGSGLAQALEEINPAEVFDKQTRITRLGEGGIPSVDSIPDEARSVQPSHMGFMDPIRTPESFRVGVDLHMARASRKGRDGRIYTQVRDNGGKLTWKSPQDLAEAAIVTPEVLKDPFWSDMARVPVMQGGKLEYVTRDKIDYTLPDFSSAFSPLANLIPFVSATKPGRVSMGSRYMTQALPVANAEAPWVQSGITGDPEGRSYEDDYGKHMGAVRADKGGRVVDVHDGVVKVKYDDGTSDDVELYQHHPFNRKTYIHQTPLVRPGDTFKPGQLLAKSNYTDDTGATALGLNMRVAYFPYKGLNFEDAQVISESAAKRLTSEHMYQHELEVTDKHKTGLKPYIALFAGKYDRSTLAKMDEKGVIRVGETVEYGQPLVLAAKEADRAHNKIHKKRQPGYTDDSVTWKHHDPGVVTDVVWGKGGPVVLVKSSSSAQVGDKLSGRYGDKGVIAAIVPDDQMPHDKDGKPYEVLLSPDGIITRTNPSQKIESALGKIAAATGKPVKVPDFNDVADLEEWTEQQLRQHGLRGTEDVYWPEKGVRVPDVGTGYRFLMKLHHTAECFDSETEALTSRGWVAWPEIRGDDALATIVDGRMVFEQPLELVQKPYSGDLFCFSGRYVDYAVTPNHELYVRGPQADSAFVLKRADAVHGRRFCVPQFGMPHNVDFSCDADVDTVISVAGLAMTAGDYAELVGWWASEGYAKVTRRRAYVTIYQSRVANPEKFSRIESLVARLNAPYSIYRSKGIALGVSISSRALAEYLKKHGTHSHNKRLPRELFDHHPETLRRAYAALMWGDGNSQQTATGPRERYTTVSKGLADDVQELCIRMGIGAVVRKTKHRATMTISLPDGRSYVSPCRQVWECGIALARTVAQIDGDRNPAGFAIRPYSGVVYCATMRTGLLYVRRNGKPMLSGNSKGQGRDSGAYSTDETPAKGGETGCFVGDTEVMVYPEGSDSAVEFAGASPYPIPIRELVERQFTGDLPTVELPKKRRQPVESVRQAVTDWFHYRVPAGDIVTITLANGESFSCTKNHELVCKNHRKVLAGDVRRGDVLLGWAADVEVAGVTAHVATTCRALVDVYDITVAGTHLYNLAAGVVVSNSKRLALLDVNALLSHGGTETLRDAGAVRGQKNEDLWMQFMSGLTPGRPRVPMVYEKFINQLKAAGINVVRNGFQTQVMALTRKDVDTLAGDREIRSGDTVRFDRGLKPIKGGLFDDHLTGGHAGKKWSYIRLPEPMPNPVMEEPIRRILGLTGKQFEAVLRGEHEVAGFGTGPKAIAKALDNINLDKEIDAARAQYYSGKASARDAAVRRWGYLKSAKRLGLHPREWVLDKAPVLPPAFRPVSLMGDSGIPLVSDPNYLYKELLDANKNYKDLKDQVGADDLGHERLAVYHAFKAITGLGDPVHPKLQEKGVKGVLKNVFGTSPKFGTVQRKLISSTVDSVGRAVITPNPDFDMDTVGIPEKQAFAVYRKSIVRRLRRRGMDIRTALHHVREKTDLARDVLTDEMENRPVYINRAPVLHRFGIMAFKPKLVKGDVLQVSPLIVSGFNADFDGDAMQFHVPMTDEAVKEAYDRLLPSRSLLSPADFKSPVHKPGQQYLAGLYHATRRHEAEGGKKRRSRVFRSVADVVAAHARGEIRADEDVQILE